jgi:hypothetical protein
MTRNTFHVLLTRFNVRRTIAVDPRVVSHEWLETRMRLFRQITLPSVVCQSCQPDAWLVFFDERTPEETRAEFQQLATKVPLLKAEYCCEMTPELCAERIGRIKGRDVTWLLSTRLDNDDALNRRFIETLQSIARPGVREFINPTLGLIVANGRLYRKRDYSSPFITLSEPAGDCRTVWIDQHQRLARHGRVRQFALPDAWIQVVHGGNLANQVRGVRISPTNVSTDALATTLSASVARTGFADLMVDNTFGLLRRYSGSAWRRGRRMWADRRAVRY